MTEQKLREIAETSPALKQQSTKSGQFAYPPNFRGRVPLKVVLATEVHSDFSLFAPDKIAFKDQEYFVWVNSYGAVSAILSNGEKLGLRPQEFDVTEWHPCTNNAGNV